MLYNLRVILVSNISVIELKKKTDQTANACYLGVQHLCDKKKTDQTANDVEQSKQQEHQQMSVGSESGQ